ncbi:helix-turn-helix domain-containing protein [Synechococcus sp. Nb3U1]|uniref:helix-turn-helix domain-containing protein n=1 Tax=Synechococcus sp. Nb3U1 TaxID=1914529 RepID=UPI001F2FDB96|nr:helix-turn-helix domain-containing protein [Synechococcus sp. Nb3U1]MCF2971611.1 helix-turn-helix domain-containing protein [Synechococcus sp. Nb3U1]
MRWEFKLEPAAKQVSEIENTLEVCRNVWNSALRERKDWLDSRRCPINACSIRQEFILPADTRYAWQCKALTATKASYPRLKTANAQVLQQVIRSLESAVATEAVRIATVQKAGADEAMPFPSNAQELHHPGWNQTAPTGNGQGALVTKDP